jgi:hypothetical protein
MKLESVGRWVRGGAAAAALSCAWLPGAVRADEVHGYRSELLVEKSHVIDLTLHAGYAKLVVRRTVHNGGPRHDQATFSIDTPEGGVATGLRTLGTLGGQPRWFAGELLEAEAAAARYRELTGIGGYYPKDPALLSWRSQDSLSLQVFPCAPRADKTVEYTLVLPTTYRDGAHHLSLPALGTEALRAEIHASAGEPGARLLVGGAPAPRAIRPERDVELDFALVAANPPLLDGELTRTEFAPGRVLTHFAARLSPRLSEVPRGAYIALVVDASLSTDSGFVESAKVALDAYLSHFGDARVELLLFDRKISRPFGRFVPVAEARRQLATLPVQRRNGSDVDRALAEADRLLTLAPASRARRIVLLTDGLTRASLTPERLRAATLKSGAVTHVGLLDSSGSYLTRDDEHPWVRGLEPNRGIVWRAGAAVDTDRAELEKVYEEWARPIRLHHFHWLSPDLELATELEEQPQELTEGQGLEGLVLTERTTPFLSVEGSLWTERVTKTFTSEGPREKLWSALVFGSPLLHELSEAEMMTLALRGGAVSPVTSYLAIEPGVRPSTEGLEEGGSGYGVGAVSMRSASCNLAGRAPALDREGFLYGAIGAEYRLCGGSPGRTTVTLETTSAEIVSVELDLGENQDSLLEDCVREAVWALSLPAAFDEEWNSWTVYL